MCKKLIIFVIKNLYNALSASFRPKYNKNVYTFDWRVTKWMTECRTNKFIEELRIGVSDHRLLHRNSIKENQFSTLFFRDPISFENYLRFRTFWKFRSLQIHFEMKRFRDIFSLGNVQSSFNKCQVRKKHGPYKRWSLRNRCALLEGNR